MDLHANIHPEFPPGWNSASDIIDAFVLVAALELRERQRLNSSDPFASGVYELLPPRYKYDPLGALLRWGPYSQRDYNAMTDFRNPTANHLLLTAGEEVGRLPMIGIVWRFVDDVIAANQNLRMQNAQTSYTQVLKSLGGLVLGAHGTVLFMAAFERMWFSLDEPRSLSDNESRFLRGVDLVDLGGLRTGPGALSADGTLYVKSIWLTAFRLIERKSPGYYIAALQHRIEDVTDILDRGTALGLQGALNIWPGWRT